MECLFGGERKRRRLRNDVIDRCTCKSASKHGIAFARKLRSLPPQTEPSLSTATNLRYSCWRSRDRRRVEDDAIVVFAQLTSSLRSASLMRFRICLSGADPSGVSQNVVRVREP